MNIVILSAAPSGDATKSIIRAGKKYATPLFITLIIIEFSDLIFAVDSIPAVLAISDDLFIVYTSNVFAILGLQALYFALAGVVKYFRCLVVVRKLITC